MAVVANNVYFSHQKVIEKYTLNHVSMNVPVGCIYGLLGPSGCGKTTLLKCIIGLLQPNLGSISLFGYKPGDELSGIPGCGVGYMPQELAIQYDLTIEEILRYFGKLYFMKSEHLSNEIEFLVNKLELEDKRRLIAELSCGQKRRVSLAIAMLNKPRLLILDEPTAGVDPILSEVIWNMLKKLSSTMKTTIIITTHYINEAKRANCVAFMRKGFILEENNPKKLLKKYKSRALDDVFLKLCVERKRRKSSGLIPLEYERKNYSQIESVKMPYPTSNTSELKRFAKLLYAIIWKFMVESRRSPQGLCLILTTTLCIIIAVKVVVGQTPRDLPVAWVVDENTYDSNYSQLAAERVMTNCIKENADTEMIKEGTELYLPDVLKKLINSKIIKLVEYSDFSSAMRDAKTTEVRGIIHLKSNFSQSYLDCDPLFTELDGYVTNETVDSGSIHIYLDTSNLIIAETIRAVIEYSVKSFRKSIAGHFNINQNLLTSQIVMEPINFEEDHHITSIEDIFSSATFITPGIVVFNSFASCIGLCILSLLTPSERDMFVREYAAGVRPVHRVLGQAIARFMFMFFNAALNLLAIVYILNVPCRGSVALVLILMWLQMLLGLTTGIFMSSSMNRSDYSILIAISITVLLFASNGVIWCIESQPYYMQWLMKYSPLYFSTNTLRVLLVYSNASFRIIWPGFALTALWTLVAFFAGIFTLSLKK